MNDLQIFENPEFGSVRTVEVNGTPWLVGKDVATALGYKNPQRAIRDHVDAEDKGVTKTVTPLRRTGDAHHQRIRLIQPGDVEQAADSEEVPALGHQRGAAQHPQAWGIHDPADLAGGHPEPRHHDPAVPAAQGRAGCKPAAAGGQRCACPQRHLCGRCKRQQ